MPIKSKEADLLILFQTVPVCSQLLLVGHLLITINCSVNFPVYYLGNCRKVVRIIFSLCDKKTLTNERSPFAEQPTLTIQYSETGLSNTCTVRRENSWAAGNRRADRGRTERESTWESEAEIME